MKMCGDPEDAKDILQETLLRHGARRARLPRCLVALDLALHHRPQLLHQEAPPQPLRARRAAVARRGDRRGEARRCPIRAPARNRTSPARELEAALARAIAALEPMYREVLVLRDIEGLTAPEVARCSASASIAVKSRLHRARLAVRTGARCRCSGQATTESPAQRPVEVPRRADAVLAPSRRRDQRRPLCADGAPSGGLRPLPRRVRVPEADLGPVPRQPDAHGARNRARIRAPKSAPRDRRPGLALTHFR